MKNCTHGLPSTLCAICTSKRKRQEYPDFCSMEDERPIGHGGRYYPTREEEARWDKADRIWAARCDEDALRQRDQDDEMDTRHAASRGLM